MTLCSVSFFFFSSRRRHTRCGRDWSSDVCSSDLRRRSPSSAEITYGSIPALEKEIAAVEQRLGQIQKKSKYLKEEEIGRASWRERGEISVGAGLLKKKKKTKK